MDLSPDPQFLEATRHDGWTPALKGRFLALLAEAGNVRLAARRCGLSAQSAYAQRRRDPLFARGWAGAMVLARQHAEQVLADRAIDGVEEQIYYRGELVGTRRRYDTRLLLAHLARLDRQVEAKGAAGDADRFDELVALVSGTELPDALADRDDVLPSAPARHAEEAAEEAELLAHEALPPVQGAEANEERDEAIFAAGAAARAKVEATWDAWRAAAWARVDELAEARHLAAQDCVNLSTSLHPNPPRPLPPEPVQGAGRIGEA